MSCRATVSRIFFSFSSRRRSRYRDLQPSYSVSRRRRRRCPVSSSSLIYNVSSRSSLDCRHPCVVFLSASKTTHLVRFVVSRHSTRKYRGARRRALEVNFIRNSAYGWAIKSTSRQFENDSVKLRFIYGGDQILDGINFCAIVILNVFFSFSLMLSWFLRDTISLKKIKRDWN